MARTQRRVDLAKKRCSGKKSRAGVKASLNRERLKDQKAPAKRVEIDPELVLTNRLRTRKPVMAAYFPDKQNSELKQREQYPIEDLLFKFRSKDDTSQLFIARWKKSEVMAPYISDECKEKFNKRIKQGKPYEPKPDWERVKTVILSYQKKQIKVIRTESFLYNYAFPVEDIVCKVDDEKDKYLIEWELAILAEEVVKSGQYIGELYKFNESYRQALMEAELSANGVEFRNQVYVQPTVEDPEKGNVKENDGGIEALVDNLSFDLNNYADIVDDELKEKDPEVHEEEDKDEESEEDHVEEVNQEEVDKVDDENQNEEMDQEDDEDQNTEVDEANEVHQEDEVEEEDNMNQNSEIGQNAEVAQENQDIMKDRANVHVQVEAIIEQINVDLVIKEVPVLRDHHIENIEKIENINNIENRRDIELIDWEETHNSFVVGDHNWNWIVHAFGLMEDNDDDPLLPTDNDPVDGNEQHGVFEINREKEIRVVDDEVPIDPLDKLLNENVQRDPLYQTFEQLMYNS